MTKVDDMDISPGELMRKMLGSNARMKALDEYSAASENLTPGEVIVGVSYADKGLYYCPICGIPPRGPLLDSKEKLLAHFTDKHPESKISDYV